MPQTIRYNDTGLGCTFDISDEETCDGDGHWVESAYYTGSGAMLHGWEGDAWCDEHRPDAPPAVDHERRANIAEAALLRAVFHLRALESRVSGLSFPTDQDVVFDAAEYIRKAEVTA